MTFRQKIYALMAGIVALVVVLILTGVIMSGKMLAGTDLAYNQGVKLAKAVDMSRSAQVNFQRQVQEWKNVLIRGGKDDLRDKHWKGFEEREALMDKELNELKADLTALGGMDKIIALASKTQEEHKALGVRYRTALQKYSVIDSAAQQAIDVEVRGMDRPTSAGIDSMVAEMQTIVEQRFKQDSQAEHKRMVTLLTISGVIAVALMLLLLALSLAIARSVYESLGAEPEAAVKATARISTGDLTERFTVKKPQSLIGALDMMQRRLRNISLAIREVAFDIENRTSSVPPGTIRDTLRSDVDRLRAAIDRLQIDRTGT